MAHQNISHEVLLKKLIAPRSKTAHKGLYGHVLVVGGGLGMPGAPCLAAQAALRVGSGAVSIAMHPDYACGSVPGMPEAMIYGVAGGADLLPLLQRATLCVIGPGLGMSDWAQALCAQVMQCSLPLVVDASALRWLAHASLHSMNWVLTPHPGEAAELLGIQISEIQVRRTEAVLQLQQRYGGCAVLKGAETLVYAEAEEVWCCTAGNPGMATAGMGDVLSGVIGGLIAQGMSVPQAAKLGVYLHAVAADKAAAQYGERGLVASDLMPYLRQQVNATA